jgi:AraC-like DNA-binding protein
MAAGIHPQDHDVVRSRPGGLPLIVILPHDAAIPTDGSLLRLLENVRPAGILPHHEDPAPEDLSSVLRQPPEDLGVEVVEYVRWRGIPLDRETAHLIRRTVTLSSELRSISGLARSLYLSRRALGRRFMARGLPVPSHWLHFARLLRVTIRLQSSGDSVLSVGYDLGYPDGFSLSNQMARLTGYRPSEARMYLGWEWLLEAWLRQEADSGGLSPDATVEFLRTAPPTPASMRRVRGATGILDPRGSALRRSAGS